MLHRKIKNFAKFGLKGFCIFYLLLGLSIFAQEEIDPASFLPKGCNEKGMNCGYLPTSPETYQAFPLSPNSKIKHRGLPSSHDLSSTMPPVGSQGNQGSCVAWATTYALKSYQEKKERNWTYDISWDYVRKPASAAGYYYLIYEPKGAMTSVFSPAFTYNQINRGVDQGSFIGDALDLIVNKGAVPYNVMPYNEKDFRTKPNNSQFAAAQKFKGLKYYRVDFRNVEAMKAEIYKGNPIVFGMLVDTGFSKYKSGVYDRPSGSSQGGHAMTIVGYDDDKTSDGGHKGAYKIINSWGINWGEKGYGWVSYKAFANLNKDAWVLVDQVDTVQDDPKPPVVQEQTTVISAPASVTASRGNYSDKVVVNWSTVSGANVYILERAESTSPNNYQEVAYIQTTNYEDTGVTPDLSYKYRVISGKVEEESEEFSVAENSPIAEGYAKSVTISTPIKIAGLNLNMNGQTVQMNWNADSNSQNYEVGRYNPTRKVWQSLGKSSKNQFVDRSPQKGIRNYYVVRGISGNSIGPWSDATEIYVGANNTTTKPSRVSNINATRGEANGIRVTWSASPGATVYVVYRYLTYKLKWAPTETVSTTQFHDNSSEAKTGFPIAYVVVAGNSAGYSDYSDYAYGISINSALAKRGNVLPPPTHLQIKMDSAGVAHLSWDAVKGSDEYYIFSKKKGDKKLEFLSSTKNNSFHYTLKSDGDSMFFAVKSKSSMGGESIPSELVVGSIPKKNTKKARFLKEAGIENFVGNWSASYWDGKKSVQNLKLEISANGNNFSAKLSSNGTLIGSYSGTYAAMSDFLETKDFNLQAKGPEGKVSEISELVIANSKISKTPVEIGFVRD